MRLTGYSDRWTVRPGETITFHVHSVAPQYSGQLVRLIHGDENPVTVPLEIATSYRARAKGLLGRDSLDGAMLLSPAGSIHTFRMRMPIDVAYLDRRLTVIALRTMPPGSLGLPRPRSRHEIAVEMQKQMDEKLSGLSI